MKPLQVQIVKKIILVVEWAIFLGLLIGVVLFVQNVWLDYLSKATSVKQYSETYHELEAKLSRNLNERLLKFVEKHKFLLNFGKNHNHHIFKFLIFGSIYFSTNMGQKLSLEQNC